MFPILTIPVSLSRKFDESVPKYCSNSHTQAGLKDIYQYTFFVLSFVCIKLEQNWFSSVNIFIFFALIFFNRHYYCYQSWQVQQQCLINYSIFFFKWLWILTKVFLIYLLSYGLGYLIQKGCYIKRYQNIVFFDF